MTEVHVSVELFVLADAATVMPDGRVNVLGAVPEFWSAPMDDPRARLTAVLTISTPIDAAEAVVPFGLRLRSADGAELVQAEIVLGPAPRNPDVFVEGARAIRSSVITLDVRFEAVGPHTLELLNPQTGELVASAPLSVRLLDRDPS